MFIIHYCWNIWLTALLQHLNSLKSSVADWCLKYLYMSLYVSIILMICLLFIIVIIFDKQHCCSQWTAWGPVTGRRTASHWCESLLPKEAADLISTSNLSTCKSCKHLAKTLRWKQCCCSHWTALRSSYKQAGRSTARHWCESLLPKEAADLILMSNLSAFLSCKYLSKTLRWKR